MDANELWERAGLFLRERIPQLTYEYLIKDNLFAEAIEKDTLIYVEPMDGDADVDAAFEALKNVFGIMTLTRAMACEKDKDVILRTAMDALKPALNAYLADITAAVQQAGGNGVRVEILTRAEIDHRKQMADDRSTGILFNERYTFDTFVVGASNRFAHAAAIAVSEAPGLVYNPLFIYGGSGLGKTHLIHAIGHHIRRQHPDKRLLYITSEAFTNELISSIQQGRNLEFRAKMRNVDVLMVDDIQSIAGRDSTQMEFFNTFNDLYGEKKQIILTSDRPPKEIARLEERLSSRFAWGLICDIKRPDLETRIAILRAIARREMMNVPDDVIELVALNVDNNIRELEEKMNRLKAFALMMNKPYTESLCREALREVFEQKHQRAITPELVLRTVCNYFNLGEGDLTGASRRREVAVPRQIAMYLTRDMTSLSLPQIGSFYGNRDHTTVLHACSQITAAIQANETFASQVSDLKRLIMDE